MSETTYETSGVGIVDIRISADAPDDLFTRMAEGDLPANLYGVMTRSEVFGHWTYNAIRNGVHDVSQLDGWADMERGLVTFDVTEVVDCEVNTASAS